MSVFVPVMLIILIILIIAMAVSNERDARKLRKLRDEMSPRQGREPGVGDPLE